MCILKYIRNFLKDTYLKFYLNKVSNLLLITNIIVPLKHH